MNVSPPVQRQDEKRREKERTKVGNNNGQLRIANTTSGGARIAAWANRMNDVILFLPQFLPWKSEELIFKLKKALRLKKF